MRASGSYFRIIDLSMTSYDTVNLSAVVPLLTRKGRQVERVTINNYLDILGYDLAYNPRYLGLREALQSVSQIVVFRMNKNAYIANAWIPRANATPSVSASMILSPDDFGAVEPPPSMSIGVCLTSGGNWFGTEQMGVTLSILKTRSQFVADPTNLVFAIGQQTKNGTVVVFDAMGNMLCSDDGTGTLVTNPNFTSGVSGSVDNLGNVTLLDPNSYLNGSPLIEIDWAPNAVNSQYYSLKLFRISPENGNILIEDVTISFVATDPAYFMKVRSNDMEFFPAGSGNTAPTEDIGTGINTPVILANAADGTQMLASDLDLGILTKYEGLFIVMNGITDVGTANAFTTFAENNERYVFRDFPNFADYFDAFAYSLNLKASRFGWNYAISDIQETDVGDIAVYPSVKVLAAYARMFNATGFLNFPPAGYHYAAVSAERLFQSNFNEFRDQLKTNKINYLWGGPSGPVIWEQRTSQAAETDLSYCHANVILTHFAQRLLAFGSNFDFLLMGPSEYMVFVAGIEEIIDSYVRAGWLWAGAAHLPSWQQIMDIGIRNLEAPIGVKVAEDSEERTFLIRVYRRASDV